MGSRLRAPLGRSVREIIIMKKAKHTPGPWVETSIEGWDGVKPLNANLPICNLVENNPANASLIAAAPEMLEMLEILYRYMDSFSPELNSLVFNIISKAKGYPHAV